MTPEKQRISIAEACGYKFEDLRVKTPHRTVFSRRRNLGDGTYKDTTSEYLPDYLNDLNAMNEAEKVLNIRQRVVYADELCRIWTGHTSRAIPYWWYIHEAPAAQRAEAFLRTIGKWEAST